MHHMDSLIRQLYHFATNFDRVLLQLVGIENSLLPRDAMLSAVYAVVVRLCVCLLHSGIVSKRLNVGSRK